MTDLPHVIAGDVPTKEHDRIFEAYLRAHKPPAGTVRTAGLMNEAIDWWNALQPEESACFCGRPGCDEASHRFATDGDRGRFLAMFGETLDKHFTPEFVAYVRNEGNAS